MTVQHEQLQHIEEGYAYTDGDRRQLYNTNESAKAVLFRKCIDFGIGPLNVHACVDTSGPSISVAVTLLGVTLANCELSQDHRDCKVGGSIDGFKAEVDLSLDLAPLQLEVDATLCAPIIGCDQLHTVIPL